MNRRKDGYAMVVLVAREIGQEPEANELTVTLAVASLHRYGMVPYHTTTTTTTIPYHHKRVYVPWIDDRRKKISLFLIYTHVNKNKPIFTSFRI